MVGKICLVTVGKIKGTGTVLLNHHVKKGNTMVVTMDLDQNLFPSKASFNLCFFLFPLKYNVIQYVSLLCP